MKRTIVTVITAVTGDRVVVGAAEIKHALKHFILPTDIFLELLERILKNPTEVYVEQSLGQREFRLFYRLEDGRYLLAIVKKTENGSYFASMYSTGKSIRNKHRGMRKIRV